MDLCVNGCVWRGHRPLEKERGSNAYLHDGKTSLGKTMGQGKNGDDDGGRHYDTSPGAADPSGINVTNSRRA